MALGLMAIIGGFIAAQGVIQGLLFTYPPWITGRSRQAFKGLPNVAPPIDQLISMRYRGILDIGRYMETSTELGYQQDWAERMYRTAARKLDAEAYVRIWRREEINEETLDEHLEGLFMTPEDMAALKKSTEYFPGPGDLIRFAIREVYNASIRSAYGMDEDITTEFLSEAKKAAVPDDQARNYWAAHWDLPSVTQGFEMRHRDVIDDGELDTLLRTLDIMPYWRDKLKEIAYSPFTRVDVRRMQAMGKLTHDETKQAYKDIGFKDDKAQKMLEFTLAFNQGGSTSVTRGSLEKAFKLDIISQGTLTLMLRDIGFEADTADFYVNVAVYEKRLAEVQDKTDDIINRYRLGALTMEGVRDELSKMGLPTPYIDTTLASEAAKLAAKLKMPTRTDLKDWLGLQLISEKQYADYMLAAGYRQTEIELYLSEIAHEVDTEKVRYLPVTTYQRWLGNDIISPDRFTELAREMEYSERDISNLILETMEAREG